MEKVNYNIINEAEPLGIRTKSFRQAFVKAVRKNPARTAGIAVMCIMVLISILAPHIAPYDPKYMGFEPFLHPSWTHLLGTDNLGKDIFSQLIFASRNSLAIGFAASTVAISIGFTVGLVAGYYRGKIEDILLGITDTFIIIPGLPLMILFSVYLGPGLWTMVAVISMLWWCGTARVIHSRVIQVREMSFIESSRAMGFSDTYIVFHHIWVNTLDIIVARWSLAVASAMMTEAGLAFIGLGDPFQISWGGMISNAFNYGGFILDLWWWYIAPGVMICICAIAFFLIAMRGRKIPYKMEMM
jgi:peptide/nickel transport system permease protein